MLWRKAKNPPENWKWAEVPIPHDQIPDFLDLLVKANNDGTELVIEVPVNINEFKHPTVLQTILWRLLR